MLEARVRKLQHKTSRALPEQPAETRFATHGDAQGNSKALFDLLLLKLVAPGLRRPSEWSLRGVEGIYAPDLPNQQLTSSAPH
jgi:hypothetical protein